MYVSFIAEQMVRAFSRIEWLKAVHLSYGASSESTVSFHFETTFQKFQLFIASSSRLKSRVDFRRIKSHCLAQRVIEQ